MDSVILLSRSRLKHGCLSSQSWRIDIVILSSEIVVILLGFNVGILRHFDVFFAHRWHHISRKHQLVIHAVSHRLILWWAHLRHAMTLRRPIHQQARICIQNLVIDTSQGDTSHITTCHIGFYLLGQFLRFLFLQLLCLLDFGNFD